MYTNRLKPIWTMWTTDEKKVEKTQIQTKLNVFKTSSSGN